MTAAPTGPGPDRRLRDSHVGDKTENIRILVTIAPWMFILLVILEALIGLSTSGWLFAILVLNPLLIYLVSRLVRGALDGVGSTVVGTLLATRGTAHTREFSEIESLMIRGRFAEAAEQYTSHLVAFPDDTDARIRLAVLIAEQLDDPAGAIAHFLRARESGPTARQETLIGNALIDLYRSQGDQGALRAELARFARIHRGSAAGRHAEQALGEMRS